MNLTIPARQLRELADQIARFVPSRPYSPALSGLHLAVNGDRLTIHATDGSTHAWTTVDVDGATDGAALLPARLFTQQLAKLPDAPLELAVDDDRVRATCGRARFSLRQLRLADLPAIPPHPDDAPTITIPAGRLEHTAKQVLHAAAQDPARPTLAAVQLTTTGNGDLSAQATDSYRLAAVADPDRPEGGEPTTLLLPIREYTEIARAAAGQPADANITVTLHPTAPRFHYPDGRTLLTAVIDGSHPDVDRLWPDTTATTATVARADLVETLARVSVLVEHTTAPVSLEFDHDSCHISCSTPETGAGTESITADLDGETTTILFNPRYLRDALSATTAERIAFSLNGGQRPAVLAGVDDDHHRQLLMPMRPN